MTAFKKINKNEQITKLNDKVIDSICNALRAGAYVETAAVMADVSKKTFYTWIKQAHRNLEEGKKKNVFVRLLHAVEKAQEESTMRDLYNIDAAAMGADIIYERYPKGYIDSEGRDLTDMVIMDSKGKPLIKKFGKKSDWSASAWRLERKNPKDWGRQEKVEHSVNDGSLNINFTKSPNKDKK